MVVTTTKMKVRPVTMMQMRMPVLPYDLAMYLAIQEKLHEQSSPKNKSATET